MRADTALDALVSGLQGHLVADVDWQALIALANHTLLTPALFSSLAQSGQIERLPGDVRDYLAFIDDCNRNRNLSLRAQLIETVAAFNSRGIVPILLKGAVPLFVSPPGRLPSRMTSDLDIAVEAGEEAAAKACLEELGYREVPDVRGMARPQDAGILELRRYRPDGFGCPQPVQRDGLRVKIPSLEARAMHWIMHDLLKEGDYWRGRIDLRHLHDLAQLAESEQLDWAALRTAMPNKTTRNALDTQLLTLHHFFGTKIPADAAGRPMPRLQHWRRIYTVRHPVSGAPLRLAGNLAWGLSRLTRSLELARRNPIELVRRAGLILSNKGLRSKI
ncbi:nucleotidyltransferase family protein [Ensifer sp. ENS12]|uniref:nucleotidyltransferase family protein n=1 Tax=unclassified Ensifer TaxID=2633371 RepID=UPI000DDD3159|nr:nucleotidyltransferase family protein [Ensifer sp. ENS12]MBV7522256.1 nucleotidyltransferase family protein [Ensifer sp. ENS12]